MLDAQHRGTTASAPWVARTTAHPNIALVKYWGKRDTELNLPAVGSLSITLDTLASACSIAPRAPSGGHEDLIELDGQQASGDAQRRIGRLLALMLGPVSASRRPALHLVCQNNFPTGAGLASSASGFAALAVAIDQAAQLSLSRDQLGVLARRGSGSATRSLFGGFVLWPHGQRADGQDCTAQPLFAPAHWPLEVVVVIVHRGHKAVNSRQGMERCRMTSPYYEAWCAGAQADLDEAQQAVAARDFARLAAVSEHSCRKMHAVMHTARPCLDYWTATTWAVVEQIHRLQSAAVPVFFTSDAGPQIKAVCAPGHGDQVAEALGAIPGVLQTLRVGLGDGARRVVA